MTTNKLADRVLMMLINGIPARQLVTYCQQQGAGDDAEKIIADARLRLTRAADFDRDEELGKSVSRLEDLYAKSIAKQETKTALYAQREINRLLGLYAEKTNIAQVEQRTDDAVLELITSYVLPLQVVDESYPVEEHVRVLCEIVRSHGGPSQ